MPSSPDDFRFLVAFSFAGPHRDKVREIAEIVAGKLGKERVFFDEWYEHEILGSDMDVLLQRIYLDKSLMVVTDFSEDHASREWTQAEARAIRALRKRLDTARDEISRLRLLNIRLGEGDVPGLFSTEGYLDGVTKSAGQCAETILKRTDLLLKRIGDSDGSKSEILLDGAAISAKPPIRFYHPATNDEYYSHREAELKWLDDCAKSPEIRIATITGVGGLGKTSLVGHWIEKHEGWQQRSFLGVFFYSFYSDRSGNGFFPALLEFIREVEEIPAHPKDRLFHHLAAFRLRDKPYLVVLDGLEVLQIGEDDRRYGWIAHGELNEFVARCGASGESLLILTSRFPFPQISAEHPAAASSKNLPLLSENDGAALLARCGIKGDLESLQTFSSQFGGHPLALRLFAGACVTDPWSDPVEASRMLLQPHHVDVLLPDPVEQGLDVEEQQIRKQRQQFYKLLSWFQEKLPPAKRRLLEIVALFKEPVSTGTVAALASGIRAMREDFGDCDNVHILYLLDQLRALHLLQREDELSGEVARWAAHPIIRDVFREKALKAGNDVASQFAQIVAGKGSQTTPKTIPELRPVLEAIEVLLEAGKFGAAKSLYDEALERGQLFYRIPAPQEGLRCVQGFIQSRERRNSADRLGSLVGLYLSQASIFAAMLGELEDAKRSYREFINHRHHLLDWRNVSVSLSNLAITLTRGGFLQETIRTAGEALFYAGVREEEKVEPSSQFPKRPPLSPPVEIFQIRSGFARRANALSLAGRLADAALDFERSKFAHQVDFHLPAHKKQLDGCSHLVRLGETAAARKIISVCREVCDRSGSNYALADFDLLLGALDLEAGDYVAAEKLILRAVKAFRDWKVGESLPTALIGQARLRQSMEDCEEAWRLAARGGMAIDECDALNLRALLRRKAGQWEPASEDARRALKIAEDCAYYWGRHEALRQLRDTAKASGSRADEMLWDEAERELTAKMKPEIEEAVRIHRENQGNLS